MNESRKKLNISNLKDSIIQKNKLKEGFKYKQPKIRLSLLTNEIKPNSPVKINIKKRKSVFENFNNDTISKLTEYTKINTNDETTNNEKNTNNIDNDDSNSVINEVNDSYVQSLRKKKKHSSAFNFSEGVRQNLLKKCQSYEKKNILTIKNKQRKNVINQLMKNRRKIRELMIFTNNSNSINILSKRVESINNKIIGLMKLMNGDEISFDNSLKNKSEKKINTNKENYETDKYDKYLNFNKHSFRFVNKFLKICDIIREYTIMDIKTVIGANENQRKFKFLRKKSKNEYVSKTEYTKNNRNINSQTLYRKNFKIKGFTTFGEAENTLNLHENFDDILYDIKNKSLDKNFLTKKNQQNTISTNQSERNKFINNYSFNRPSTSRTISYKNNNSSKKSKLLNNKKSKTFRLNLNDSENQDSQIEKSSNKNSQNYYNELLNKINFTLNDGKIIKETLLNNMKEYEPEPKKQNNSVLLKMANKLYAEEDLKRNPSKIPKKKIFSKPNLILNLENEFVKELKLIPKTVRPVYRDIFKKMLTEDRILNKRDPRYMNAYEQKMVYVHEQDKFKKEAIQNMYTLRDNVFDGHEDQEVFKNEMIFDNYGNINSLEWLLCKHKLLFNKKNRLIGAYNPKEKLNLNINYPPEQIII
jgi:hypothetical protein